MNKLKYTPGPWNYSGYCELDGCYHVGTIGGENASGIKFGESTSCDKLVADVCGEFDAQLIATAPDMLEALVDQYETICNLCKRLNPQHENCKSCNDQDWIKDIIENATGLKIEDLLK